MARARELISKLQLAPHPEGGHFRELHRSSVQVRLSGEPRSALTCIYFLLACGERSRWHRVKGADELWHHLEGGPLELFIADPAFATIERRVLSRLGEGGEPQLVVPADAWQAARSVGEYCLVGCSVGPGFEFRDFELAADVPSARAALGRHGSGAIELL